MSHLAHHRDCPGRIDDDAMVIGTSLVVWATDLPVMVLWKKAEQLSLIRDGERERERERKRDREGGLCQARTVTNEYTRSHGVSSKINIAHANSLSPSCLLLALPDMK